MMKRSFTLFFLVFVFSFGAFAQDSLKIGETLKDSVLYIIKNLQLEGDTFFDDGMFYAVRQQKNRPIRRDDNIWFPVSIAIALENSKNLFDDQDQVRSIDTIISKIKSNYWRYTLKDGGVAYNFWQHRPYEKAIPDRGLSRKTMAKMSMADEVDDSALIAITLDNDSLDRELKKLFSKYVNGEKRRVKRTLKKYTKYDDVYLSWFAENWWQDIDLGMMSNQMMFVFKKNLPLNQYDTATINFIDMVIRDGFHREKPHIASVYFKTKPNLYYLIARMMSVASDSLFQDTRKILIKDIQELLPSLETETDKILLMNALYYLGVEGGIQIDYSKFKLDAIHHAHYYGSFLYNTNWFLTRYFGLGKAIRMEWRCQAYSYALLLEYLDLKKEHQEKKSSEK